MCIAWAEEATMQEQNIGYGMGPSVDRLSSLRQASPPPLQAEQQFPKKRRNEVVIGVLLVVVVVCVVALLTRQPAAQLVDSAVVAEVQDTVPPSGVEGLLDGEALIGVALEVGNFPSELSEGDTVRVVVTPSVSADGDARELNAPLVVKSIDVIGEFAGRYTATLLGSRDVATAIATSGPVHLTIVKKVGAK